MPVSSLPAPKCCIFSQESLTLVRPRVAELPLRKWPREDSDSRSLLCLNAEKRSQHDICRCRGLRKMEKKEADLQG